MFSALLLFLATPEAHADDMYMYGVGPYLGTIAVPGRYPASFPSETNDSLLEVRNDVELGAMGRVYLDGSNRVGGRIGFGTGFGAPYKALNVTVEYDSIRGSSGNFDLHIGAGLGAGMQSFGGENNQKLAMATYLGRAMAGAIYRDKDKAYEFDIVGSLVQPGVQTFTNRDGDKIEIENEFLGGAFYWRIGVEVAVMFGDFKPPSKKKKKKSSSSSSKKKSSSSSGSKTGESDSKDSDSSSGSGGKRPSGPGKPGGK